MFSSLRGQDGVASQLQLFSLEAVCRNNPEVTSSRRHPHGACDDREEGKKQEKQSKVQHTSDVVSCLVKAREHSSREEKPVKCKASRKVFWECKIEDWKEMPAESWIWPSPP